MRLQKIFLLTALSFPFVISWQPAVAADLSLDQESEEIAAAEETPSITSPKTPYKRPRLCTWVDPRNNLPCKKVFPSQSKLDRHMRTHTGEKLFVCQLCSRRFTQKPSLHTHMKKHEFTHTSIDRAAATAQSATVPPVTQPQNLAQPMPLPTSRLLGLLEVLDAYTKEQRSEQRRQQQAAYSAWITYQTQVAYQTQAAYSAWIAYQTQVAYQTWASLTATAGFIPPPPALAPIFSNEEAHPSEEE